MKRLALLASLAAFVFAAPAHADRGGVPHRKAPTAPVLSFSCDGALCVYAISPGPLAPLTAYDTSIHFENLLGVGCNTGTGGWHSDASGALVQVLDQTEIKCGAIGPGTVTAWARNAGTAFDAPAIPGTSTGPVLIG